MADHRERLTIRVKGGPADEGRLPLAELLRVGRQIRSALRDVATVLTMGVGGRPGRVRGFIEHATELDVVANPRRGSFVLDLELPVVETPAVPTLEGLEDPGTLGERALSCL